MLKYINNHFFRKIFYSFKNSMNAIYFQTCWKHVSETCYRENTNKET